MPAVLTSWLVRTLRMSEMSPKEAPILKPHKIRKMHCKTMLLKMICLYQDLLQKLNYTGRAVARKSWACENYKDSLGSLDSQLSCRHYFHRTETIPKLIYRWGCRLFLPSGGRLTLYDDFVPYLPPNLGLQWAGLHQRMRLTMFDHA